MEPPRIRLLTQRHDNEIVIPASRLLPSLIGSAVHAEIEKYEATFEDDGIAQEKEFVTTLCGIKFSGRPDWYDRANEEVGDEKTTSVWTYTYNRGGKKEHLGQININGWLIRTYGYPCTKGWIELIFLDWKRSNAARDNNYPRPSEIIRVDSLWDDATTKKYVEDRVTLHLAAESMDDKNLPPCSDEDQWRKPPVFAVMKKGNKTSTKNCSTLEEAESIARSIGRHAYVDERPGERTRCEYHCDAQPFCNQYREERSGV